MDAFVQQFLEQTGETPERLLDNVLVIDENLRTIKIPPKAIIAGAMGDKDVNWVNFKIPRYYDGTDLSEFQIRVNYINANGDPNFYTAQNVVVKDSVIYFSWLITMDAVAYAGDLQFSVCLISYEDDKVDKEFTTATATLEVPESIKVEQYIDPGEMEDIIARVLQEVTDFIEEKEEEIDEYIAEALEEAKQELLNFDNVHQDTSTNWNAQPQFIGTKNHVYVYTDLKKIKIADGISYLIDQAFIGENEATALLNHIEDNIRHVTTLERATWNNKVSVRIDPNNPERLIFETSNEEDD